MSSLNLIRGQERFNFLIYVWFKNIFLLFSVSAGLALFATVFLSWAMSSPLITSYFKILSVMENGLEGVGFWAQIDFFLDSITYAYFDLHRDAWLRAGTMFGVSTGLIMMGLGSLFRMSGRAISGDEHLKGSTLINETQYAREAEEAAKQEMRERFLSKIPKAYQIKEAMIEGNKEELRNFVDNYLESFKRFNPVIMRRLVKEEMGKPFIFDIKGKLKLSEYALARHCLFVGQPGTGKTTIIKKYLKRARKSGEKCFILDINGELSGEFGREDDIYIGLTDKRSKAWSFSQEVDKNGNPLRPDRFAEFAVPENDKGDPIWWRGPRMVLDNLLTNHRFEKLWSIFTSIAPTPDKSIGKYLSGLAKNMIGAPGSGQETGIIAGLIQNFRFLEYLNYHAHKREDNPETISAYKWVHDNDDKRWVFVTYADKDQELSRPLSRFLVNIAMLATLERDERNKANVPLNFIMDEKASIGRIDMLPIFASRARKYKGRLFLGVQCIGQFHEIYGEKLGDNVLSLFGNNFFFRIEGEKQAKAVSAKLGDTKIKQKRETTSLGSRKSQERSSLAESQNKEMAVMESELTTLPDGHFFLKSLHLNPVKSCLEKVLLPRVGKILDEVYEFPEAVDALLEMKAEEAKNRKLSKKTGGDDDDDEGGGGEESSPNTEEQSDSDDYPHVTDDTQTAPELLDPESQALLDRLSKPSLEQNGDLIF